MRKKLLRFAENQKNPLFLEEGKPLFETIKGKWHPHFFAKKNPLFLELGCGTGKYAMALARENPNQNFIGIDIKGYRMWVAAHVAAAQKMSNIAFLRCRIEALDDFFCADAIEGIYITFPDPRPKKSDAKKRLTSSRFLALYQKLLPPHGVVHLKTDHQGLYDFTLAQIKAHKLHLIHATQDLYQSDPESLHTRIQTTYESRFLSQGLPIKYLAFSFPSSTRLLF